MNTALSPPMHAFTVYEGGGGVDVCMHGCNTIEPPHHPRCIQAPAAPSTEQVPAYMLNEN